MQNFIFYSPHLYFQHRMGQHHNKCIDNMLKNTFMFSFSSAVYYINYDFQHLAHSHFRTETPVQRVVCPSARSYTSPLTPVDGAQM